MEQQVFQILRCNFSIHYLWQVQVALLRLSQRTVPASLRFIFMKGNSHIPYVTRTFQGKDISLLINRSQLCLYKDIRILRFIFGAFTLLSMPFLDYYSQRWYCLKYKVGIGFHASSACRFKNTKFDYCGQIACIRRVSRAKTQNATTQSNVKHQTRNQRMYALEKSSRCRWGSSISNLQPD